jgi:hypothetical protein
MVMSGQAVAGLEGGQGAARPAGVTQPVMVLATGICSITPHHVGELLQGPASP